MARHHVYLRAAFQPSHGFSVFAAKFSCRNSNTQPYSSVTMMMVMMTVIAATIYIMLKVFQILTRFIFIKALQGRYYSYYSHFTDEEKEEQKLSNVRSHSGK